MHKAVVGLTPLEVIRNEPEHRSSSCVMRCGQHGSRYLRRGIELRRRAKFCMLISLFWKAFSHSHNPRPPHPSTSQLDGPFYVTLRPTHMKVRHQAGRVEGWRGVLLWVTRAAVNTRSIIDAGQALIVRQSRLKCYRSGHSYSAPHRGPDYTGAGNVHISNASHRTSPPRPNRRGRRPHLGSREQLV